MKLDEAVKVLVDSVLHTSDETFSVEKLHRAIKSAGYRFVRETGCSVTTIAVPLTASTSGLNIQTTIPGFEIDQFYRARIGLQEVKIAPWSMLVREASLLAAEGTPRMLAFNSADDAMVSPTPDQNMMLLLTYRRALFSFTPGASSNPELNIPEEWVWDVIWWGARTQLLFGLPGHTDADPAAAKFEQMIADAKGRFASTATGTIDRNTHPGPTGKSARGR